jgi:hypothetical protein
MGSLYGSTNSLVSNTGAPLNQRIGIAVGLGSLHNHFLPLPASTEYLEHAARMAEPNGRPRRAGGLIAAGAEVAREAPRCLLF